MTVTRDINSPAGLPKFDDFYNPIIESLKKLGGSGSNEEIEDAVADLMGLPDETVSKIYKGNRTHFSSRLAWARSYLKAAGLLENSARGIWALTQRAKNANSLNKDEVNRAARVKSDSEGDGANSVELGDGTSSWKDELLQIILNFTPVNFERLCQRILRESGFVKVEITGRTGDGGIDGLGVLRLAGLINFPIAFQCKRYSGAVGSAQIRDFRGSVIGRADKGLFITTGTFTRDAKAEATRAGAPPIDLLDGDELAQKLKELQIGVKVQQRIEEDVEVDKEWFRQFAS